MSGGSYNYIYNTLSEECEGYMHDEEMNALIKDLCKVLHDLEWWRSCDISEEDYRKTVAKFKQKWLHLTENNVGMSMSHRAIAKVINDYVDNHRGDSDKQYTALEIKLLLISDYSAENKDGMTNGEVIQALFPEIELVEIYNGRHRFFLKGKESTTFDLKAEVSWWNNPYQKGE